MSESPSPEVRFNYTWPREDHEPRYVLSAGQPQRPTSDEVEELRAKVSRIEALADRWHQEAGAAKRHGNEARMSKRHAARSIVRAIKPTTPDDAEGAL